MSTCVFPVKCFEPDLQLGMYSCNLWLLSDYDYILHSYPEITPEVFFIVFTRSMIVNDITGIYFSVFKK